MGREKYEKWLKGTLVRNDYSYLTEWLSQLLFCFQIHRSLHWLKEPFFARQLCVDNSSCYIDYILLMHMGKKAISKIFLLYKFWGEIIYYKLLYDKVIGYIFFTILHILHEDMVCSLYRVFHLRLHGTYIGVFGKLNQYHRYIISYNITSNCIIFYICVSCFRTYMLFTSFEVKGITYWIIFRIGEIATRTHVLSIMYIRWQCMILNEYL